MRTTIFIFAVFNMINIAYAESWVYTGGPVGGIGYDVRIQPTNKNIMFFTDNSTGVIKSNNSGQSWFSSNNGIDAEGATMGIYPIFCLTIDPNDNDILWTGTNATNGNFGIYKSIDGGVTWQSKINGVSLNGEPNLTFRGFTVQPGNSNIVYAQAEVPLDEHEANGQKTIGRVYKSVNGGGSWSLIWEGDNLARYLLIHPTDSNILYLSTGIFDRSANNCDCSINEHGGEGVLKSLDGGTTWFPINNGITDLYIGSLRMHPTNPDILIAGGGRPSCPDTGMEDSGVFKTVNGGASWTRVLGNWTITTVNFAPSNPDVIYAGGPQGFFRSSDGGATWNRHARGENWGPPGIHAGNPIDVIVDPDDPDLVYVNNYGGGVFKSKNGVQSWENWSKGFSGANIKSIDKPSDGFSSLYTIGRSGPFLSNNFGDDWIGINNGDTNGAWDVEWYSIAADPSKPNIVLMAGEHTGKIYRSDDCGGYFNVVVQNPREPEGYTPFQGFKSIVFSKSNPNIVYAGLAKESGSIDTASPEGTVVLKSIDNGRTFLPMPSIIDGNNVNELAVDPANHNMLYAATTNGIYQSQDGATSWTHIGFNGRRIESLAVQFKQQHYIVAGEMFGGIWISSNGGASWTGPHNSGFNSPNPELSSIVSDPIDDSMFFASDESSGVYQSLDKALTWKPFPDERMSGLTLKNVTDLAIDANGLYAATFGRGVFRYARGSLVVSTPTCSSFPWTMFLPTLVKPK